MSFFAKRLPVVWGVVGALMAWLMFCFTTRIPPPVGQGKEPSPSVELKAASAKASPTPKPLPKPQKVSPLAARLNAADGTVQEDVEVLHGLIGQYFVAIQNRQGRPIGSSRDLARVLTGDNPLRHVFIPADHPAINDKGYLVDRWGTPYQLHQLSTHIIDVRSAGPDRQLYNADDVVDEAAAARP